MPFSGDVFEAIPFGGQPTTILTDEEPEPAKHYQGEVAFAYGLLITQTCDMYDQLADEPIPAHPYRVLVPILPLEDVAAATDTVERNVGLLRSRDNLPAYRAKSAMWCYRDAPRSGVLPPVQSEPCASGSGSRDRLGETTLGGAVLRE